MIAAFTGGGGKTSLIWYLAEKFSAQGKCVIVTTTTHMAWEAKRPFAEAEDAERIERLLKQYGYVITAHHEAGQPKISGPDLESFPKLSGLCDLLLVEADGARRFPLKVPAKWEPVIPDAADVVVGVTGLDSLGKKISETAHRPEVVAAFLEKDTEDIVTWMDVAKIAVSDAGLRKGVGERRFLAFLNKMDVLEKTDDAKRIVEYCRRAGVEAVCGSVRNAERVCIAKRAAGTE